MLKIKQLKGKNGYKEIEKKMSHQVSIVSKNINFEEVWFLEHEKVFTAGSSSPKGLKEKSINKIPLIHVNRGGKLTYHGPGQLIIYPILNIKKRKINIIEYINLLEEICIKVFKNNSIKLFRKKEKNRGLWISKNKIHKKIIFIGLRYSKGVIYHGLSINFDINLIDFRKINPCGLDRNEISSLKELNINYNKKKIINELKEEFIEIFDLSLI
jgi:lipoyl(octanoyl) transferase